MGFGDARKPALAGGNPWRNPGAEGRRLPPVEAKNRASTPAGAGYAMPGNEKRRQNERFFEET
jgi:hypothetical protein